MDINILSCGACENAADNAPAICRAIDQCERSGGGRVIIPAGHFISGTIYLKNHVELHLSHGAVLEASPDLSLYNDIDEYPENMTSRDEGWCGKHLIICRCCEDIAITGTGTIRGTGLYSEDLHPGSRCAYWREGYYSTADGAPLRPGQLICFIGSKSIVVEGVTIERSCCWNLYFLYCEYIKIRGITVHAGKRDANSDGIDLDMCRYATVSDSIIDTGDDCIAIRCDSERGIYPDITACEYITVSNCILSNSTCSVRLGVGTGKICHVLLSNLILARSGEGFTFQLSYLGQGKADISNVLIQNITGDDVGIPFQMHADGPGSLKNLVMDGFVSGCMGQAVLENNAGNGAAENVRLSHVSLTDTSRGDPDDVLERNGTMLHLKGIDKLTLDDVTLSLKAGDLCKPAVIEDCTYIGKVSWNRGKDMGTVSAE